MANKIKMTVVKPCFLGKAGREFSTTDLQAGRLEKSGLAKRKTERKTETETETETEQSPKEKPATHKKGKGK